VYGAAGGLGKRKTLRASERGRLRDNESQIAERVDVERRRSVELLDRIDDGRGDGTGREQGEEVIEERLKVRRSVCLGAGSGTLSKVSHDGLSVFDHSVRGKENVREGDTKSRLKDLAEQRAAVCEAGGARWRLHCADLFEDCTERVVRVVDGAVGNVEQVAKEAERLGGQKLADDRNGGVECLVC
jgi:hypothetical protein